jgi:hypothetical protein
VTPRPADLAKGVALSAVAERRRPVTCKELARLPLIAHAPTREHVETGPGVTAGYLAYLPAGYASRPARTWPTIVFLHGSGQTGPGTGAALDGVASWSVEERNGRAFVGEKRKRVERRVPSEQVGMRDQPVQRRRRRRRRRRGETLRQEGYAGRITMLSADASLPCDRPSLSKATCRHRPRSVRIPAVASLLSKARH